MNRTQVLVREHLQAKKKKKEKNPNINHSTPKAHLLSKWRISHLSSSGSLSQRFAKHIVCSISKVISVLAIMFGGKINNIIKKPQNKNNKPLNTALEELAT